jgi:hypothetical protein
MKRWCAALIVLATLACAKAALFKASPAAESYHARIAAAVAAIPHHFGTWVSQEVPVPEAAITILRPNVTISRRYTNVATGEVATLLLVQCRDARDLFGHYPPVCYVSHGFRTVESSAGDWRLDDTDIHGMVYTFASTRPQELTSMTVYDFMILPNGTTCRDMDGVYALARNSRRRMLGAAQLQILVSATMPHEQRDALFLTLVKANQPAINAILAGDATEEHDSAD